MGLFKSLFSSKNTKEKNSKENIAQEITFNKKVEMINQQYDNKRKVNSNFPEEIKELILLASAEKYPVKDAEYPEYSWFTKYGISFPDEYFRSLAEKNLIRYASASESLSNLKAKDLKEIAEKFNLSKTGKKDVLCDRILSNLSEKDLNDAFESLNAKIYWKVTPEGIEKLKENPYIQFYLDKHEYILESIGIGLFELYSLCKDRTKPRIRDLLWGQFNRLSIEFYQEGISKGDFTNYCCLLEIMALFLKEEEKNKPALEMYLNYLFYNINFKSSLPVLTYYSLQKNINNAANLLYTYTEMMPITASRLSGLASKSNLDSRALRDYMVNYFNTKTDVGLFSSTELADYLMAGLSNDKDYQEKACLRVMKNAKNQMIRK